jgi:hypothetical protein
MTFHATQQLESSQSEEEKESPIKIDLNHPRQTIDEARQLMQDTYAEL